MPTISSPTDVTKNDRVILIMGPPGCGKSNLIDHLTKFETHWATEGLSSSVAVRAVRTRNPTRADRSRVVLVDTPGCESTNNAELKIKDWLEEAHITLTGIVYLHCITDRHMKDSPFLRLPAMFVRFLQDPSRLVFLTTMWDRVPHEVAEKKEEILRKSYLGQMLKSGATMARFYNKQDNEPWGIINRLLDQEGYTRTRISSFNGYSSQHRTKDPIDRSNSTQGGLSKEVERGKRAFAEWNDTSRRAQKFTKPSSRRMVGSFFAKKPKRLSAVF